MSCGWGRPFDCSPPMTGMTKLQIWMGLLQFIVHCFSVHLVVVFQENTSNRNHLPALLPLRSVQLPSVAVKCRCSPPTGRRAVHRLEACGSLCRQPPLTWHCFPDLVCSSVAWLCRLWHGVSQPAGVGVQCGVWLCVVRDDDHNKRALMRSFCAV